MAKATVRGQERHITSLYNKGYSVTSIAKRLGVATTSVSQMLARLGLRERTDPRRIAPKERKQIAKEYAAGVLTNELASRYGISKGTVRVIARAAGVLIGGKGNRTRVFTAREVRTVCKLWSEGMSQTAIGIKVGASQQQIGGVLSRAGMATRKYAAVGERHGMWKGGRAVSSEGYVSIKMNRDDPMASMRNTHDYVLEHRLVMARSLGRPLRSSETVHHINGDKTDNRLENLELHQGKHGKGAAYRCLDCGSHNVKPVELTKHKG